MTNIFEYKGIKTSLSLKGKGIMRSVMIRKFCLPMVSIFILAFLFTLGSGQCYGFEITIDIAPNVLNLGSQGQVVTVHTNIAYGEVDASSIYLNDVEINSWKADDRGYFVAKFLMDEIKDLVDVGYYKFTLTGTTIDKVLFSGTQIIKIVDNIPSGKN